LEVAFAFLQAQSQSFFISILVHQKMANEDENDFILNATNRNFAC